MAELDKFYTKPEIALQCIDIFNRYKKGIIIEPSAGNGAFSNQIECLAYDILPEHEGIIKQDFFTLELPKEDFSIIGNPPFGKKSSLAIDFFTYATDNKAKVIGFIVPVTFKKWSVQKELSPNYSLIEDIKLPANAFLVKGKEYSVRCTFQIWAEKPNSFIDLRLKKSPPIAHEDFTITQYNCTPEALKYFNEDWDFAVYRQGRKDYTKIFYPIDRDTMPRNLQYMFFKAKDNTILERLLSLNFTELSEWNMSTPGFGKADLVMFYKENFNK